MASQADGSRPLVRVAFVNFLNPFALAVPVWSILIHVTVTAMSNCIVRGAFTLRVYRMSDKNWMLCIFITVASLLELGCSIAITAKAFGKTFLGLQALSSLFYADFAAMIAADTTIALSLILFLHTSRTGIRKTESLINILIMYTINTGLLTAADCSAGLITFVVMPDNLVYVTFYLQLSKLYVNAYLATLNARENLRDRSQVNEHVSINLSQMSHPHGARSGQFVTSATSDSTMVCDKRSNPLSITVTTHVDKMMEEDDLKERETWGDRHAV